MRGGSHRGQGRKPNPSTIAQRQREQGWSGTDVLIKLPTPPNHLTKTAKAEWRKVGKLLQDDGLLTDRPSGSDGDQGV